MLNYSQEEIFELFQSLPLDLKEFSLSLKVTEKIKNICRRYDLKEIETRKIVKFTGLTLVGLLPPEQFAQTVFAELKIDMIIAQKIYNEINSFIFFRVKDSLKELYSDSTTPVKSSEKEVKSEKELEEEKEAEEKEEEKEDTYREPIN